MMPSKNYFYFCSEKEKVWLNGSFFRNQKGFLYGIAVKNLIGTFSFKSVQVFPNKDHYLGTI